ncbi:MAG: hypothetical protein KAI66_27465 [Lentisphaeria bacterium]|nr:hypothetical protein [Lentisphaeria bacterium]
MIVVRGIACQPAGLGFKRGVVVVVVEAFEEVLAHEGLMAFEALVLEGVDEFVTQERGDRRDAGEPPPEAHPCGMKDGEVEGPGEVHEENREGKGDRSADLHAEAFRIVNAEIAGEREQFFGKGLSVSENVVFARLAPSRQ